MKLRKTAGYKNFGTPPFFYLSLKDIFGLFKQVAEDIFIVLFGLFAFQASELFEQAFLLGGHIGGRYHFHDDVFVTAGAAMHDRHTHTLKAERAVALRACR